jgi:paraquat-inducible protein A
VLVRGGGRRDRALAFALAGIPLLAIAAGTPLVRLTGRDGQAEATVWGAARALHEQGRWSLAALVLATTLLVPALQILAALVVVLVARWSRATPRSLRLWGTLAAMRPWNQVPILLLGLLVTCGKLTTAYHVQPGVGFVALVALVLVERSIGGALALPPFLPTASAPALAPALEERRAA